MRCLNPLTVGFQADGKTICWSPKRHSKEYPTFQLPCGKCIACRLEYGRQWAVRCVHEASMHTSNMFLTLTYSDENLKMYPQRDLKSLYIHFQQFQKNLRNKIFSSFLREQGLARQDFMALATNERNALYEPKKISIFVTGEYGDLYKRPHWHALIFNYRPADQIHTRTTALGHPVFTSAEINSLWNRGFAEFGDITLQSAGYCARYAAKKLVHGHDADHDFHPYSKKSSHSAIGKRFVAKHWEQIFSQGFLTLEDGTKCGIPRYYEKWLQKNEPTAWVRYVTQLKNDRILQYEKSDRQEKLATDAINWNRLDSGKSTFQKSRTAARSEILEQKFKRLQSHLKGDI